MAKIAAALRPLRSRAGFTLVELLVSGVIVSVMVFLAFFSLRLFLNEWEHRRLGDIRHLERYRIETLLRHAIEGVWEYYITDPEGERQGDFYPYFKGEERRFAFVTTAPVFHEHEQGTAAAEYLWQESAGEGHDSGRLLYREAPLDRGYLRYDGEIPEYRHVLQTAAGIAGVRIRYFGVVESHWDESSETVREVRMWRDTYDGRKHRALPELIEITVVGQDGQTDLRTFRVRAVNSFKSGLYHHDY